MRRSIQKGFTLIELMIVVAIIGILAAIALPQYQSYIAKSQISRVMYEAGNSKTAIEQCVTDGKTNSIVSILASGVLPANVSDCVLEAIPSSLLIGAGQGANAIAAAAGTGYVQGVINANGTARLTATFGNGASAALTTGTASALRWTRDTSGAWTCVTTASTKYAPNGCTSVASLPA
jgi:type IV pilus assembly protein PilA